MGTLASALAHELNQPLTAIANFVSAGATCWGPTRPQRKNCCAKHWTRPRRRPCARGRLCGGCGISFQRARSISRILSLGKLINDATTLGLVGAREKGVEWWIEIDPGIDNVLADRVQIQQVMVNLMRNAIEAMEKSPTKHLTIRARPQRRGAG